MTRTEMETYPVVLCAGCLNWYAPKLLKLCAGHPYCVDCYPRATKSKAMELPGHGGAR